MLRQHLLGLVLEEGDKVWCIMISGEFEVIIVILRLAYRSCP